LSFQVAISPEAGAQLLSIYHYIAGEASPETAKRFTDSILDYCASFESFPHRGSKRDDLRPNLRIVGFRRRVSIALAVGGNRVDIVGIFYGGQNYEAVLSPDE
jgi:toxin ParE1/3/4